MKKVLTVSLCLLLAFSLFVSCSKKGKEAGSAKASSSENIRVALLTDATGIDDKSFNAAAWRGILAFYNDGGKGKGTLYTNITAQSADDYLPNLKNASAQGFDVIITTGFTWAESDVAFAKDYPNQKLVIVDVGYLPKSDNFIQYEYEEQQGSYLVGVAAAMQAKNDGIENPSFGFIGGVPGATITKFEMGYIQGILSVFPNATIKDYYANSWGAPELAKTQAKNWYDNGVYCIFSAAGGTGGGTIDQAKEYRKAGKNVWAIGVDSDQYEDGIYADGKSAVLTSMLKVVENSTVDALTKAKNGTWEGGVVYQNMANGGVDYATTNAELCASAKAAVEQAKADILSGKVVVLKTAKEVLEKYPQIGRLNAIDD
jgi:basic membrane protein A